VREGNSKDAFLLLQDGSLFFGRGLGAEVNSVGETVFNTGMVGYCESLTDPSYAGQILTFTYPLIGNYGVPPYDSLDGLGVLRHFESDSIKVRGVVVQEACSGPSHWASRRTLGEWLASEGIPGVEGIDTRALVTRLREVGVMMGMIANGKDLDDLGHLRETLRRAEGYDTLDLVEGVSVAKPITYGGDGEPVVLLDCGAKLGIVRNLLARGYLVIRMPYSSSYADVMKYAPKGVVVSNGPGDPQRCRDTIETVGRLIDSEVPLLGICLGEQLVGLSQGAMTFKLKYGHRGQNKPCVDLSTGRGYVTSQNHGYALEHGSLGPTDLRPWFVNADDHTIEGVQHRSKPCYAVQFHPEATPGPYDTGFVFDRFTETMGNPTKRGEEIRSMSN
jgi:carbamoyl-phosphate synthase small subunit